MYNSDSIQTYYRLHLNEKKFMIHLPYRNCILLSLSKLHYLSTARFSYQIIFSQEKKNHCGKLQCIKILNTIFILHYKHSLCIVSSAVALLFHQI